MAYKFNPFTGNLDVVGTVSAAADGTEALPGISFANDLDTGIYRPGADQLALATNGTGRLFVDSSGNVKIGGTSAVDTEGLSVETTASSGGINIISPATGRGDIFFGDTDDKNVGQIRYAHSNNSLTIRTNAQDRLTIDDSGNVGVGTSNPSATVHISADDPQFRLQRTGAYSTSAGPLIQFQGKGPNGTNYNFAKIQAVSSGSNNAGELQLFTNSAGSQSERMRIDSSGRVGIGTTSPSELLHLSGTSNPSFQLTATNDTTPQIKWSTNSVDRLLIDSSSVVGARVFVRSNQELRFGTNDTERMRIDSSGRLLVGTSTGGGVNYGGSTGGFHLVQGSADAHIMVRRAGGTGSLTLVRSNGTVAAPTIVANNDVIGQIRFVPYDGTDYTQQCARISAEMDGIPGANDMPGRLVFSTTADGASSPTERMRIHSNGIMSSFSNSSNLELRNANTAGTSTLLIWGTYSATGVTDGTNSFRVYTNGNVQNTNNSYGAISDIKLKENIVDASSQWDDLKALQVRNYNFKEGQTHTQIGLVAQEVELVSPGLVSESPDRDADGNDLGTVTKSVNYSVLYMKAVKALQEAMERIEQLETEMAEVKSQLQAS